MKPLTATLIAINVLAYLWEVTTGNPQSTQSLIDHGAEYGPLVAQGQYWRIVSAAFLHGGLTHIGFNMLALYQVGGIVEMMIGPARMVAIYFAAVIGAGLTVYYFNYAEPTLGASGAVFGLFGAMAAIGIRFGSRGRALIMQTLPIIAINLLIGFSSPGVSNAAHIGGLLTGFIAGLVLAPAARRRLLAQ